MVWEDHRATGFDLFQHGPEFLKDPKILQVYWKIVEEERRKVMDRNTKKRQIVDIANGSNSEDSNKKNNKIKKLKETMIYDASGNVKADGEASRRSGAGSSSSVEKPSPAKKTKSKNGSCKRKREHYGKPPVDPLPETFDKINNIARQMGGSTPVLFYSKVLTHSDLKIDQNRLLLTDKRNKSRRADLVELLNPDERKLVMKEEVSKGSNKKDLGLPVCLVDGDGNRYTINDVNEHGKLMTAKLRFLNSNEGFRIIGSNYKEFVKKYSLEPKVQVIRVYIFHVDDQHGGNRQVWIGLIKEPVPQQHTHPVVQQQQQQYQQEIDRSEERAAGGESNDGNSSEQIVDEIDWSLSLRLPYAREDCSSVESEEVFGGHEAAAVEGESNHEFSSEQTVNESELDLSLSLWPPCFTAADSSSSSSV